ncbi:SusC/RagA family TonB-linked outer membrane protein [Mucilaginibacter sp.]
MYKIYTNSLRYWPQGRVTKPLLVMKLTIVILIVSILQAEATTSALALNLKNITLKHSDRNKPQQAAVQLVTITGNVTDSTGAPLPGATVKIKDNYQQATTTDANGSFTLKNVQENAILQVSFIGYVTKEVKITSVSNVTIVLKSAGNNLNDVVVVGYGTVKRENMIGSVAQVNAKDINDRTSPSLSNALTGQLAGVSITQSSGQPGADGANIQIRGVGSYGASPAPLILVDGIPANSFDEINPSEVESVSVSQDASTAAIYGSRAANGVILVTTKSGKSTDNKLHIDYNGYVGVQKPTDPPQFADAAEYATLMNIAQPGSYTSAQIAQFAAGDPNTDWIKMIIKNSAFQTAHNLSFSNNTESTQYMLSFGYMDQDGIVANNNFQRYNVRLNMTNHISKNLTLTTRLSGAQYDEKEPAMPATLQATDGLPNMIGQLIRTPPVIPIYTSPGQFSLGVNNGTPYTYFNNDSFANDQKTDLLINERLDYKIISGLTVSVIGAYTQMSENNQRFNANQVLTNTVTLGPGTFAQYNDSDPYKTLQELIEYKKEIKKHHLDVLLGHTYEYQQYNYFYASRGNYYSNTLTQLQAGDPSTETNTGYSSVYTLDSYFGRLDYNYDNKYLVEGDIRDDGSSKFPPNLRYAVFPGVAVGWRISQENFLKDRFTWLNDLKLKASYGVLGNQNLYPTSISDLQDYPYQTVLSGGHNYPFGGVLSSGYQLNTLTDPNLHWESTRTEDLGLETTLFNNLTVSASYYDRYTYNILQTPAGSVSQVLGYSVGVENAGKLSNKGLEFTASFKNHIGPVGYNISGNFSTLNENVTYLGAGGALQPSGLITNSNGQIVGYPLGAFYGYKTAGLFTSTAEIAKWPNETAVNPSPQPGDIKYVDLNGDGKITPADETYLGSSIPKYSYGLNLNLNYKNFSLAIVGQGVGDVVNQLNDYMGWAFYNQGGVPQFVANNYWSPTNNYANAKYPRLQVISNAGDGNTAASNFYLYNASYFKIRSLQVGYSFPSAMISRLGIKALRVNLGAQNLFTFTKFPKGNDPELSNSGGYYPNLSNYTLGVNLSL